ncbi:hypothetical protein [Roseateles amylovorans]|uniref:J domain-containing protein n=1 Tax=Roseateles amylovorans TaxID=2978473 RepID=A0ABY6AWF3_9BURK|nr:hypothetical protein [Roseateles amylovorans]UXH76648.1 hypothetical protein N4261_16565 [Roseateles amylovorans]
MPVLLPLYFFALGLDEHATEADIKTAYATRLKRIDRAKDPEGFQSLRQNYEAALAHVREGRGFVHLDEADLTGRPTWATQEAPEPSLDAPAGESQDPSRNGAHDEPRGEPQSPSQRDSEPASHGDSRADVAAEPSGRPAAGPSEEPPQQPTPAPASVPAPAPRRAPPIEPPVDPATAAAQAFDALAQALARLNLQDLHTAIRRLSETLAQPSLASLAAGEAFQQRVVRALLDRELGRYSALLFFAAVETFRWDQKPVVAWDLTDIQSSRLRRWIDAAVALGPGERSSWLWLSEEPRSALLNYLGAGPNFDWTSPLEEICCERGERDHWRALWRFQAESIPALGDPPAPSPVGWRAWLRWLASRDAWLIGLPLIVFALVIVPLGRWGQHRQLNQQEISCHTKLGEAQSAGWQGLSPWDIEALQTCSRDHPPPRCDDRESLRRLVTIAQVLKQSSHGAELEETYFLSGSSGLQLDPGDGTLVNAGADRCGDTFGSLIESGGWLRLGHVPTAQAITRQAAHCVMAAHALPPEKARLQRNAWVRDTWALKLLSRTDAWREAQHPGGLDGAPPPEVKVSSLVSTDPLLLQPGPLPNEKAWPACSNAIPRAVPQAAASAAPSPTGDRRPMLQVR